MTDEEKKDDACEIPQEEEADACEVPEKEESTDPMVELQEKCDEYLSGWKRARADYENLQRDTDERVQNGVKFATEGLLHQLLPTVDHFKYAFNAIPEEERESGWLQGVEHIQTNFLRVLEEHGVELIKTVGEQFDPTLHEAVAEVEPSGKQKSGTIAEEVTSGFTLHGKVIKVATVKVVK
jgi:molecular chaperone GrpE